MDISEFQRINAIRANRWHQNEKWNLLEWSGSMCGEAGEAANFAKKIRRATGNLPNKEKGTKIKDIEKLQINLAKEVADTIIYGLIILSEIGIDASGIISEVFDTKSTKYGFPERAPKD